MKVTISSFWTQKEGNQPDEYEDAFWPLDVTELRGEMLQFAVADGATESSFARKWAKLLVESVGNGRLELANFSAGLPALQKEWRQWIDGASLPWFADEKARKGAFAALVGLSLANVEHDASIGYWHAWALGDTCLVQLRDDNVVVCFPIERSDQFDNRPYLVGSHSAGAADVVRYASCCNGTWIAGDVFFLMTDAVAAWFLRSHEAGQRPWTQFENLSGASDTFDFSRWVTQLRESRQIRNDDCTLLRLTVS